MRNNKTILNQIKTIAETNGNSPQTFRSEQIFMYEKMSNSGLPSSWLRFFTKMFVSLLKIGMDDCNAFNPNAGFMSFRTGFQTALAMLSEDMLISGFGEIHFYKFLNFFQFCFYFFFFIFFLLSFFHFFLFFLFSFFPFFSFSSFFSFFPFFFFLSEHFLLNQSKRAEPDLQSGRWPVIFGYNIQTNFLWKCGKKFQKSHFK